MVFNDTVKFKTEVKSRSDWCEMCHVGSVHTISEVIAPSSVIAPWLTINELRSPQEVLEKHTGVSYIAS